MKINPRMTWTLVLGFKIAVITKFFDVNENIPRISETGDLNRGKETLKN